MPYIKRPTKDELFMARIHQVREELKIGGDYQKGLVLAVLLLAEEIHDATALERELNDPRDHTGAR